MYTQTHTKFIYSRMKLKGKWDQGQKKWYIDVVDSSTISSVRNGEYTYCYINIQLFTLYVYKYIYIYITIYIYI